MIMSDISDITHLCHDITQLSLYITNKVNKVGCVAISQAMASHDIRTSHGQSRWGFPRWRNARCGLEMCPKAPPGRNCKIT